MRWNVCAFVGVWFCAAGLWFGAAFVTLTACGDGDPVPPRVFCDGCMFTCEQIRCEYRTDARVREDGTEFVVCGWPCEKGKAWTLAFEREPDGCFVPIGFRVVEADWCE